MSGHDTILVRALIHKWEHFVLGQLLLFLPELSAPAHRGYRLRCRGVLVGQEAAELPQFITKQAEVKLCWFHLLHSVTSCTRSLFVSDLQLMNIPLRRQADTQLFQFYQVNIWLVLGGPPRRSSVRNHAEIT